MESQKKCVRSTSDSDVTIRSTYRAEAVKPNKESSDAICCDEVGGNNALNRYKDNNENCESEFHFEAKSLPYFKEKEEADSFPMGSSSLIGTSDPSMSSTSNSDSFSSCLSEGDSNGSSLNPPNPEFSSSSDSDDVIQQSEKKEPVETLQSVVHEHKGFEMDKRQNADGDYWPTSFDSTTPVTFAGDYSNFFSHRITSSRLS